MPGFDGTGPQGSGPLTGGQRGRCRQTGDVVMQRPEQGRGPGRGPGAGNGNQARAGRGNNARGGMSRGRGGNR